MLLPIRLCDYVKAILIKILFHIVFIINFIVWRWILNFFSIFTIISQCLNDSQWVRYIVFLAKVFPVELNLLIRVFTHSLLSAWIIIVVKLSLNIIYEITVCYSRLKKISEDLYFRSKCIRCVYIWRT